MNIKEIMNKPNKKYIFGEVLLMTVQHTLGMRKKINGRFTVGSLSILRSSLLPTNF